MSSSPSKNSRPAQLPLPSSDFSAAPLQHFQDTTQILQRSASLDAKPGQPSSPHSRSISNAASFKPAGSAPSYRAHPLSSPPTVTTFKIPPIPISSSTHASGITSSSFFRPSRPVHSRPSSSISITSNDILPTFNSAPPDQHPLSILSSNVSHESDLRSYGDPGSLRDTTHQLSKRLKQSREPLLPLNSKHVASVSSPSHIPMPLDHSKTTSANRMRNSFERVFRGLSLDGIRKSPSSPGHTLPRLSSTEEHPLSFPHSGAVDDLSPQLYSRRKLSHSLPLIQIASSGSRSFSPTPNHVFISSPPDTITPLSAMPVVPPQWNFQRHQSRNRFFCGGRMLTGGDSPWAFVASLTLVCGLSGVWFGTTCVWYWHNESPAVAAVGAYMCLLTVSCMLTTVRNKIICNAIAH